jgi:DNA modification methylase
LPRCDVLAGDMLAVLPTLRANTFHACVTDPPYHLTVCRRATRWGRSPTGFMGKQWDGGDVAMRPETWAAVLRVLRPGAHLLAFGGTRTFHRMACAIEDAGFELRDTVMWVYGQGFPKSLDVSKAIDREAGAVRPVTGSKAVTQDFRGIDLVGDASRATRVDLTRPATPDALEWSGWGTALKPAWEPIIVARKPLSERTVAANVLRWGCGALNIDACRVGTDGGSPSISLGGASKNTFGDGLNGGWGKPVPGLGRWPANVIHDGSDEVLAAFAEYGESKSTAQPRHNQAKDAFFIGKRPSVTFGHADTGTAARFFYCAKASARDRFDSRHPTVKPIALLRYLVRLVTRPGGRILDPFAGSGTLAAAARAEGFAATLIEREAEYLADIGRRLAA